MKPDLIECGKVVEVPLQKGERLGFGRAVVTAVHARGVIEASPVLVNLYPIRMFPTSFTAKDVEVLSTKSLLLPARSVVSTSERWSLEETTDALDQYSILRYGQPLSKTAKESLAKKFRK